MADQPPTTNSIEAKYCGFWKGHRWTMWRKVCEGNLQRTEDQSVIGTMIIQERNCLDCGFTETNKQQVWI